MQILQARKLQCCLLPGSDYKYNWASLGSICCEKNSHPETSVTLMWRIIIILLHLMGEMCSCGLFRKKRFLTFNNSWNHLPLSSSLLALTVYALKVDMVLQRGAIFWTILWIIVHSLAFSSMFGPLVPRVDTVSSPRCAVAPIHNHYHHHKIHICPKNCHFLSCWHHRQFLFWKFIWFCRDIPENPFNV